MCSLSARCGRLCFKVVAEPTATHFKMPRRNCSIFHVTCGKQGLADEGICTKECVTRSFTRPHNKIGHEPKSRAAAVIRLYKPKMPKLSAMWKPRMRVMIVPNADIITVRRKRERPGRGKVICFGIRSSEFVSENQGNQNRRITDSSALW